ncbi:hypothetical protein ABW20_dc0106379 [Dactylellina cionopaga]|nr:hypothetical protein ABW20_dc0106379 [Dactylellina cionopaga]
MCSDEADAFEIEELELEDYITTHKLLMYGGTNAAKRKHSKRTPYAFNLKLWIFFVGLVGTKLLSEKTAYSTRIDGITSNGSSNVSFQPTRRLDIVVSHYNEDAGKLGSLIDAIKAIPNIKGLEPNLIIYTKNNESDISEIMSLTGANQVTILPNEGREGGTYLHHIISRWDDLANHTLFIQAEPHSPSRIISRLKNYFEPTRTGMLDLGYRELRGCSCLDCRDEYGFRDETNFIPDLMATAHHIKCDENTRVDISYKGQFIVSATRIRSAKKALYESINNKLVGENRIKLGGAEDSLDAPVFGYAVERSWNILFQCADLTGAMDMCPGLTLLKTGFGDLQRPNPEDCGCMDG